MDAPQLLPHVEQWGVVIDEGADLVDDHQENGDVHRPRVWQCSVHIAYSKSDPLRFQLNLDRYTMNLDYKMYATLFIAHVWGNALHTLPTATVTHLTCT